MVKLLIIDDETTTRQGLIKHIPWKALGIDEVADARDGIDGLEKAKTFHPDIVLTDINMPGMNGIEMATNIKEQFPDSRLIFLSGYSNKEYLKAAINLNAISYVEKPINLEELSDAIKKAVAICLEEREKKLAEKRMMTALSENTPLLKQRIVKKLVCQDANRAEIEKDLNFIGVSFDSKDIYTVMIIQPELPAYKAESDKQAIASEVLRVTDECLRDEKHICMLNENGSIVVVLAYTTTRKLISAQTLFQSVRSGVRECVPSCPDLFCAVGQNVLSLERVWQSYESAQQTFQKLFFTGYGNIAYYEAKPKPFDLLYDSIPNHFRELLQQQKKEDAIKFLETFCEEIKSKCEYEVDEVRNVFFRMAYILFQEAEKRGIPYNQTKENKEKYIWAQISGFETLRQTKEYLIDKLLYHFESVKEAEASSRAVFEVLKYIQKNYGSVALSNNILAEHVYLTPTYLSSLFKKETGKTISEYLTEYRIEKSKDLLREPRVKLYEIARRVGYSDANYYAKAFRKQTGLTPSEFREKYRS